LYFANAQSTPKPFSKEYLDFSNWDNVVKKCVSKGTIGGININIFDYALLGRDATVQKYYTDFKYQVENADVSGFNQSQYLAFWINVYNYLAVRTIMEHPCQKDLFGDCRPLTSIRQVGQQQPSLLDTVWDIPQLSMAKLGTVLSLNNIEADYLRKPQANPSNREDVRIHGCIVCASVSCPNLRATAYTVANISAEMTDNTQDLLMNPLKGAVQDGDNLKLSEIFAPDWFADDFNNNNISSNSMSVRQFIKDYSLNPAIINLATNAPLTYFNYNWDVNGNIAELCTKNRACFPWWALLCLLLGLLITVIVTAMCVRRKMQKPYQPLHDQAPGLN